MNSAGVVGGLGHHLVKQGHQPLVHIVPLWSRLFLGVAYREGLHEGLRIVVFSPQLRTEEGSYQSQVPVPNSWQLSGGVIGVKGVVELGEAT